MWWFPLASQAAVPVASLPGDTSTPSDTAHVTLGSRLDADGVGAAAGIGQEWVVGGDGGTAATRLSARFATASWAFAAHLPFATYRAPGDAGMGSRQRTGLGNLRLDFFHRKQSGDDTRLLGVQVHLPMGDAYTWTHSASGIWPSAGAAAVYQRRAPVGPVSLIVRTALGLHGTQGFAPYPRLHVHASVAGGVDVPLQRGFGVLGEASASVWDPSPIDLAGWVRSEPKWAGGLRARAGLIAPMGTWMGLGPSSRPAGVREATLLADVSLAL